MSLRHFLEYYRKMGFTYDYVRNHMPLREYQTYQYIMYKECLEKEERRKAKEAADRAAAEQKAKEEEEIARQSRSLPQSQREKFLQAVLEKRRQEEMASQPDINDISIDDFEDALDDFDM